MSITENLLDEKRLRLAKIRDELHAAENTVKNLEYNIAAIKKQKRRQKLIQAGKIIEDAGLLYQYDPDELYFLLIQHKRELIKK